MRLFTLFENFFFVAFLLIISIQKFKLKHYIKEFSLRLIFVKNYFEMNEWMWRQNDIMFNNPKKNKKDK
jgi:hypothetical protein